MATLYIVEGKLVEPWEYDARPITRDINYSLPEQISREMPVSFPYKPIGIGKPLNVEILTIYTGDFIRGLFAGKKQDIICISAAKPSGMFNAAPRAINITDRVKDRSYLDFNAMKAGTPFIYYTKAADFDSINISVELDGRSFNAAIFSTIAGLMRKAAGLPVFLPAAGYLLGGAELVKLASSAAKEIFESKAFISETLPIRFATAGMPRTPSRSFLLCRNADTPELMQYNVHYIERNGAYRMTLVKDGKEYQGSAPYIIINVDGSEKSSLEPFTPTLASSDLLSRLYGNGNTLEAAGEILREAMLLYNDFTYRMKADKMESQLKEMANESGTEDFARKKDLLAAYLKNIQADLFKKKLLLH